jgi:hypothetical protein
LPMIPVWPGTHSIDVCHPRVSRCFTAFTTLIALSCPGPDLVCPTLAIAAYESEWIAISPAISLSVTYSMRSAIASTSPSKAVSNSPRHPLLDSDSISLP